MRSIQSGEKDRADLSGRTILFSSVQSTADHALFLNKLRRRPAAQMGVAMGHIFLRCIAADQIWVRTQSASLGLIQIDLDLSDFEKERNHCLHFCLFYFCPPIFNFSTSLLLVGQQEWHLAQKNALQKSPEIPL